MSVDVVAIDVNPILWVVWCDICEEELTEPTDDDDLIDTLAEELEKTHLHTI